MTTDDVERYLKDIVAAADAHDYEAAHSLEDAMYRYLLISIARGDCRDPIGCANSALRSDGIKFPRWAA